MSFSTICGGFVQSTGGAGGGGRSAAISGARCAIFSLSSAACAIGAGGAATSARASFGETPRSIVPISPVFGST